MSKYFYLTIIVFAVLLITPTQVHAEQQLQVNVSTGTLEERIGTFSPSSFTVQPGDMVTVDFSISQTDNYCCGVVIEAVDSSWSTGILQPGSEMSIEFEASSSMLFYARWADSNEIRAIGSIDVAGETNSPAIPQQVEAKLAGSVIDLTWQPQTGATGYIIYKDGEELGETQLHSFTDPVPTYDSEVNYTVEAANSAGLSGQSEPAVIQIPALEEVTDTIRFEESEYVIANNKISPLASVQTISTVPAQLTFAGRLTGVSLIAFDLGTDDSVVYTTVPDENGYWLIEIDTSEITPEQNRVDMTYTSFAGEEFTDTLLAISQGPVSSPDSGTDTSPIPPPTDNDNQTLGIGLMVAGVVLFLFAVVIYLRVSMTTGPKIVDLKINSAGEVTT